MAMPKHGRGVLTRHEAAADRPFPAQGPAWTAGRRWRMRRQPHPSSTPLCPWGRGGEPNPARGPFRSDF